MKKKKIELNETIYEQDCEFHRYQDGLTWSRFQTAGAIEAAILFALYQGTSLSELERRGLMVFGFILVLVICVFSLKDQSDAKSHLDRITKFEKLGLPFIHRGWPHFLGAGVLLWTSIVLLTSFNLVVVFCKW